MDFSGNKGSGDAEEGKLGKSLLLHCCNSLLLSWNSTGMTSQLSCTQWGMIGRLLFSGLFPLLIALSCALDRAPRQGRLGIHELKCAL